MSFEQDDLFDAVVFFEENCQKNGFDIGFEQGKAQGWNEGFQIGVQKGHEIGAEIGFYKGFLTTWLSCSEPISDRAKSKVNTFFELLSQNWSDNSTDLMLKLESVRVKFKQICSLLNVSIDYSSSTKDPLSF